MLALTAPARLPAPPLVERCADATCAHPAHRKSTDGMIIVPQEFMKGS